VYLTSGSALSSDHIPVLIDTICRSFFQHPPDRPDFRRTDWANFQTHLENQIPFDPELYNGMAIDTCVENSSGAVLKALAASTPKCCPRVDPRPPIQAGIQDEKRLTNRLRKQWQVTRNPALRAEVNRLHRSVTRPAKRVEERPVKSHTRIPRSQRPVAVEDDQAGDESSYSVSRWSPRGNCSLFLRKSRPLLTLWRLSFSRWPILRSQQLLRFLTWR